MKLTKRLLKTPIDQLVIVLVMVLMPQKIKLMKRNPKYQKKETKIVLNMKLKVSLKPLKKKPPKHTTMSLVVKVIKVLLKL